MYLAQLQTSNYEFIAIGHTDQGAMELLEKAWNRHIAECADCYTWEFVKDAATVRFTRTGDIWRDGTLIHSYDSSDPWNN